MSTVRIHRIAHHTTALGPGDRAVVWFQGCKRRCKGCMAPESRPLEGGSEWDVSKLIDEILACRNIEGITVSGGEPFLQAEGLQEFLEGLRARSPLGVIIYTGNTMAELREMNDPHVNAIIDSLTDILIDGEYIDELNDGGGLRGSSNQTVHFLTDRYDEYRALYGGARRDVQIMIEGDDALMIGVPNRETLESWKKATQKIRGTAEQKADLG